MVKIYRVEIDTDPGDGSIIHPLVNTEFYYNLNIYVSKQIRCIKRNIYIKEQEAGAFMIPLYMMINSIILI